MAGRWSCRPPPNSTPLPTAGRWSCRPPPYRDAILASPACPRPRSARCSASNSQRSATTAGRTAKRLARAPSAWSLPAGTGSATTAEGTATRQQRQQPSFSTTAEPKSSQVDFEQRLQTHIDNITAASDDNRDERPKHGLLPHRSFSLWARNPLSTAHPPPGIPNSGREPGSSGPRDSQLEICILSGSLRSRPR